MYLMRNPQVRIVQPKISSTWVIYSLFAIAEFVAIYLGFRQIPCLNETQLMYSSSTGAQVVAALFGLTITGYVFYDNKLESRKSNDTLFDIILPMQIGYRKKIVSIGFSSFLSILLCEINIVRSILPPYWQITFNSSFVFVVFSTMLIIDFIFQVVDPNKIDKAISSGISRIEETTNDTSPGSFEDFLHDFNSITHAISQLSSKFLPGESNKYNLSNKLDLLHSAGVLDDKLYSRLNELRKYRNLVVHGKDTKVSNSFCTEANELNSIITSIKSRMGFK